MSKVYNTFRFGGIDMLFGVWRWMNTIVMH